jgi:very-short-patch-repair endonuclease
LIDLAVHFEQGKLEQLINEADKRNLIDPESFRSGLDSHSTSRPGVARLRKLLDEPTFRLTDSELERLFLPIARQSGLPAPQTGQWINGFKVDFYWPEFRLVVETDGLRYHRTATQQAKDLVRDQTHIASGLIPLRFSHAQVRYEPQSVRAALESFVALRESVRYGER